MNIMARMADGSTTCGRKEHKTIPCLCSTTQLCYARVAAARWPLPAWPRSSAVVGRRATQNMCRGYRPKAQMKILFLLHALLKEIQECFLHLSQELSAINGLRLSTNVCFARRVEV
jgi:hypothetical protein